MIKIQNRSGCCKYCKKADTCILSVVFPLVAQMYPEKGVDLQSDIYRVVEEVLDEKYHINCTASTDCCPYCIKHKDSGCYGDEDVEMDIMLAQFLQIMHDRFQAYVKDGIMSSYKYNRIAHMMFISKEDYDKDNGYMWSALDGAIILWNSQNKPYYITMDEHAPEDGVIKYTFACKKED